MGESGREILATKFVRLESEFTEEVKSAGGQEAMASGRKGFEGGGIIVEEVNDRVGEFGSKMRERHGVSRMRRLDGKQRRRNQARLYSENSRPRIKSSMDRRPESNGVVMDDSPREKEPSGKTKRSQCGTCVKPSLGHDRHRVLSLRN